MEFGGPEITPSVFVLNGHSPKDVAKEMIQQGQRQAFYMFDMDEACRRIQNFSQAMPRVQIFYAMKSNDSMMMLKLAVALGLGFDCASPGEIYKLKKLHVPSSGIIYAMPHKSAEQMIYAKKSGVRHTTFDTSYELTKLKENWPDARLLLRIRVDSVSHIPLGEKFGCDFKTEAVELLEKAASLGLKTHVTGCWNCLSRRMRMRSIESYAEGIRYARTLFDHEARAGRKMSILDIGGGYAPHYTESIDKVSKLINRTIEELFPDPDVQIIAEPGAYICNSAFTLYCSISNVKRGKWNGRDVSMIYMNDGIYGTLRYSEKWHKLSKLQVNNQVDSCELEKCILWGPSCDSLDQVMKEFDVRLPRCTPHDWLVVEEHGAYTISFSTRFSSIETPLIRSVASRDLWKKLKRSQVFGEKDLITDPLVFDPVPLALPPLLTKNGVIEQPQTPSLK